MDESADPRGGRVDLTPEEMRALDGAHRVPFLSLAATLIVAPPREPDDPASVIIEWGPGRVERPVPGSTLWHASIEREIERLVADGESMSLRLAAQLSRAGKRWPDIEAWWSWLRTGWLAPPGGRRG